MPTRSLVRAGVAALCAAGVVSGLVTYRSERRVEDAFGAALGQRPLPEIEELFDESRPLNPGAARDLTLARLYFEQGDPRRAQELLEDARDQEPENIRVSFFATRLALARGDRREAVRQWARARELDPTLPVPLPPPL